VGFNRQNPNDETEPKCFSAVDDFINDLTEKTEQPIPHSYIAKSQSRFLKTITENLTIGTAIVLMDISENYSLTIQDKAQGHHWTCNTCTIHPVMIHLQDDDQGTKLTTSLCVISGDLKHDVVMVYQTQIILIQFLRDKFPHIKKRSLLHRRVCCTIHTRINSTS
jgi:hypothetical protein